MATQSDDEKRNSPASEDEVMEAIDLPHGPKPWPVVGNMPHVGFLGERPFAYNIGEMFAKYGDIFTLKLDMLGGVDDQDKCGGVLPIFIADPAIVQELVLREKEFPKMWTSKINKSISFLGGKGLFTSSTVDREWQTARPLMSKPFNEVKIKQYFDIIVDKSERYVDQLERRVCGGEALISELNDWNSCFTFDTVMEASLGTDLKNLEALGEGRPLDPFLPAFRKAFQLNLKFSQGWEMKHYLQPFKNKKLLEEFESSVAVMFDRMDSLIEQTRNGTIGDRKSVLYSLLFDDSPSTNEKVMLKNVRSHLVTLMVAGHETTAATIGFTMYFLAKNLECQRRAREEARRVMGSKGYLEYKDAGKLTYITACLRETLRIFSAVNLLQRSCAKDTTVTSRTGTKYKIPAGSHMYVVLRGLHTRQEDWGETPLEWNPEHFLDEELIKKRHPHSYYPFGFAMRSCIGQFFAIWEARVCLALMLNKLTLKVPEGYKFKAARGMGPAPFPKDFALVMAHREDQIVSSKGKSSSSDKHASTLAESREAAQKVPADPSSKQQESVKIYFGSNVGACEELAFSIQQYLKTFGLNSVVAQLDDAITNDFSSKTIIVTSTYNGFPPDNAKKFASWLKDGSASSGICWKKAKFALCGVGNSQWHSTFHKFPNQIYKALTEFGAETIVPNCMLDVSKEWDSHFEKWLGKLAGVLTGTGEASLPAPVMTRANRLQVDFAAGDMKVETINEVFHSNLSKFLVRKLDILENRELQYGKDERSTRHIEIALPKEMPYNCGDHLAIRPFSSPELVDEALDLLKLKGDEWLVAGMEENPKKARIKARRLLALLDLTVCPSKAELTQLAESCPCPPEMFKLKQLAENRDEGKTTLEVLKQFRSVQLDLKGFCEFFPLMKVRYYSIASSSKSVQGKNVCKICVGVVDYTTSTGRHHTGASSGMLSGLRAGDSVFGYVPELSSNFRLKDGVPIIMIGPGTGIAPFMGFLEEREVIKAEKEAVLFFGCRSAAQDNIYKKELEKFKSSGALTDLFVAFSRDQKEKIYVQNLILEQKELVWRLLQEDAVVYVCGDASSMAPAVREAFSRVISHFTSEKEAKVYMDTMEESKRYLEDVWG